MIAWLNPLALAGLALVAGPVLIHLLRQQRARRVVFPSLRFVQPARSMAARVRRLSDPWLLLVRAAIVAAGVLALARPVVLTPGRLDAWNARTARAILVDTSGSMRLNAAAAAARDTAAAESKGAFASIVIESENLRDGLREASRWLESARPARREIVLVSDFHAGALTGRDLDVVPGGIGVRGIQVGETPLERQLQGMTLAGSGLTHEIRVTPSRTDVTLVQVERQGSGGGLRFVNVPDHAAAVLMSVAGAAGSPAPSASEPIALAFPGRDGHGNALRAVDSAWMRRAALRMGTDEDLKAAAANVARQHDLDDGTFWFVIVRDRAGLPLVRAAAAGSELVLEVGDNPGSLLSAAVLRAVLVARHDPGAAIEHDVARIPAEEIRGWTRPAADVGSDAARLAGGGDARWFWLAALALLGVETWMRRRRRAPAREVRADAA